MDRWKEHLAAQYRGHLRTRWLVRAGCWIMAHMEDEVFHRLIRLVSAKTGLRVDGNDGGTLRKIAVARMAARGCSSMEEYCRLLDAESDESRSEREELTELLTVGESFFFRDKGQFELLRGRILPELLERRNARRMLRVWSAGCATGEEPYSLAIILSELIPNLSDWRLHLVGTDIKGEFLEKAKRGIYGEWSFRMVPAEMRARHFTARGGRFELDPRIRDMVSFRRGDMVRDVYPDPGGVLDDMDLILCRNVFIYYKRKAVAAIVEKMAATLGEGGYLLTGHWELFSAPSGLLKPRMFPESLAYQRVREGLQKTPDLPGPPVLPAPPAMKPAVSPLSPLPPAPGNGEVISDPAAAAEELFIHGHYREAVKNLHTALDRHPADFRALLLMASAHANLGEHPLAVEYSYKAMKADRLSAEPYLLLAHIAEETGNMDDAREHLRKVIYLQPSAVPAYLELAAIHENGGDAIMARKMRKAALDALRSLPGKSVVEPYGETAEALIRLVGRLLEKE